MLFIVCICLIRHKPDPLRCHHAHWLLRLERDSSHSLCRLIRSLDTDPQELSKICLDAFTGPAFTSGNNHRGVFIAGQLAGQNIWQLKYVAEIFNLILADPVWYE